MSDFEPRGDFSFASLEKPSLKLKKPEQTLVPSSLETLKHQVDQKDRLWVRDKFQYLVDNVHSVVPGDTPPITDGAYSKDNSIYGMVYNSTFSTYTSKSEWKLGGGDSLQEAGFVKVILNNSNSQTIEYKANTSTANDWNKAKEIVENDNYYQRNQEFGNALKIIDPKEPGEYLVNFYLDLNQPKDKTIFERYGCNLLKFKETDFGVQPIIELSHPPGNEFLSTQTATQFFTSLENSHLKLSESLALEMINRADQRYGNSYVTLGRELAKLVNDKKRHLSCFFSNNEGDEQIIRDINSLEMPSDPAAAVLIDIIKQLPNRKETTDLPVSEAMVHFRAGTCKDLESYFSSSVNESTSYMVDVNSKKYLKEGSHHQDVNPMMINLEPVDFNGVTLPAGNLFRINEDKKGFHYMRPTAFCFDSAYAANVFGEEYRNSINSWGSPDEIFKIISSKKV